MTPVEQDVATVREALTSWQMQTPTMQRANAQKARAALDSLAAEIHRLHNLLGGESMRCEQAEAELERVTAELPEDLLHLLREVDRRGGLRHANLTLNRRMGGGWSARWGNTMLLSPDTYGPERERRRTDWLLIEYPPPLKPISERVVTEEVGP